MTIKEISDLFSTSVGNIATINTYLIDDVSGMNDNTVTYPVLFIATSLLKGIDVRQESEKRKYRMSFYCYCLNVQFTATERLTNWSLLEGYGLDWWADVESNNNIRRMTDMQVEFGHDAFGNNSLLGVKFTFDFYAKEC